MVLSNERVRVAAGQPTQATFGLWAGKVRLRLVHADGRPARGVLPQFWDEAADEHLVNGLRTDENGVVTVPLPVGTYHVQLGELGESEAIGEVVILSGETTGLELRIPEAK